MWAEMEDLHISRRRPNIAVIWDVIDGMSVIYPEVKRQLVRVFVFQNIFRLNIWVLGAVIILYDWSTETPNIVDSPQRLLVMEILEL
jgi:hypothetical protein